MGNARIDERGGCQGEETEAKTAESASGRTSLRSAKNQTKRKTKPHVGERAAILRNGVSPYIERRTNRPSRHKQKIRGGRIKNPGTIMKPAIREDLARHFMDVMEEGKNSWKAFTMAR